MASSYTSRLFVFCAACLGYLSSSRGAVVPAPPYVILLHSRGAAVTPEKSKNSQTGGGYIQVTQVEPNAVMFFMHGAVATRADHKDGSAAMQFELNQDFEIVPAREGVRPPRISLSAWVIGTLNSTEAEGGTAEQAAGCAAVRSADVPLLKVCVNPHGVSTGQNLLVNDRFGPIQAAAVPGPYTLHQTFALNANQPKRACRPGFASADFDPDPRLDPQWNALLKPFRAVSHKDFGFHVLLRVVEDIPPLTIATPAQETLPPPTPEKIQGTNSAKEATEPRP